MVEALSENIEMYLKTIYLLQIGEGEARTGAISADLEVSNPSVTNMLDRLGRLGFVEHEKYQGVTLTPEGSRIAKEILRRHCILEYFMVHSLKYGEGDFHAEACRLEHALSHETAKRIADLNVRPSTCPECYDPATKRCRFLNSPEAKRAGV